MLRICESCGAVDELPRHVLVDPGPTDHSVADDLIVAADVSGLSKAALMAAFSSDQRSKHTECCAADGCPVCAGTSEES